MSSRSHGFTLIELLVVIAITTLLFAMLLPSLHQARQIALRVICQSNEAQIYVSLRGYAMDYETYTPDEPPHNGADWTPNDGRGVAGDEICGLTRPHSSNSNVALGLGQLVEGYYTEIDGLYHTSNRGNWPERSFFGEPYQEPWLHAVTSKPWSPWWGGANYFIESTYAYRSNDWSTPQAERRVRENLSVEHREYPEHAVVMDAKAVFHEFGCNVLFGDGAVVWWGDERTLTYTIPWQGLSYPGSGQWHSGYLTHLMYMADQDARWW